MTLHADLLEQARHLATRERKKPKQASLRRAVSASYYALFHLILDSGSRQFTSDKQLRLLVPRAFVHSEMKKAAKTFASGGTLPANIRAVYSGVIPVELKKVAQAFVDLQEARHKSDYDLNTTFTRSEVEDLVSVAEEAFACWKAVQAMPAERSGVELFLISMLLWERWHKSV